MLLLPPLRQTSSTVKCTDGVTSTPFCSHLICTERAQSGELYRRWKVRRQIMLKTGKYASEQSEYTCFIPEINHKKSMHLHKPTEHEQAL